MQYILRSSKRISLIRLVASSALDNNILIYNSIKQLSKSIKEKLLD